jgi:tellurite resistance protein
MKSDKILTANLFAVCFGLAGLAQAWTVLMRLVHGPTWPGNALWIVTAVVWLVTAVGYLADVAAHRRWIRELTDPTFSPFTSLLFIVPVLLSVPLAAQARGAGEVVFGCAVALTVLLGGWMTGDWIARGNDVKRWHPGYYLPSAAGGLIAGGAAAALGFGTLSHVLFGLGVGNYLLLGSIIGFRLFVVPRRCCRRSRSSSPRRSSRPTPGSRSTAAGSTPRWPSSAASPC